MMMNKMICLDRDGTIIVDKHYLSSAPDVELLPNSLAGLSRLQAAGFCFCIITNQSGIGRGYFTLADYHAVNAQMLQLLNAGGVTIAGVYFCPHAPSENCACRKPQISLLQQASRELNFALADCIVIGDKAADIELGKNAGAKLTILTRTGYGKKHENSNDCQPDFIADDLLAATEIIFLSENIPAPLLS